MGSAWLLVQTLAIVSGMLAATVVLVTILDAVVEDFSRYRLSAMRLARRHRLLLAAMLPSVGPGLLAGGTTGSVVAGVITLGVIAATMMAIFLALGYRREDV